MKNITKDKYFLDTNIFVYSFDGREKKKQRFAQNLISHAVETHQGIVSYQVIQEFLNVALKKFEKVITIEDCRLYFQKILMPLCDFFPNFHFYEHALEIQSQTNYSLYDCLIVTAAIESDCMILYSEDLKHQDKIETVEVLNPFL